LGENRVNENLVEEILGELKLPGIDSSQYSPLALAYMGDTVYELVNRTIALYKGDRQSQKLHKECSSRANAAAQAKVYRAIEPSFTDEEAAVFHRGRNAFVYTKAKNATTEDYHLATGLEAVVGHLYLSGQHRRLSELLFKGFRETGLL